MKFHVLTLFPEMMRCCLSYGIMGRAAEKGLISLHAVDIRDYTQDRHGKVDDYPYGGGAGMLMQAQPVYDAYLAASGGRAVRTVYLTPQGERFTQQKARELSGEEELVLLCGHYEGIDERVLEDIVTDYISIGDYVLTGGELGAAVMMDAIARLVPGVLGNENSAQEESFFNDLLEYPQYSRPEVWRGKAVPEVLLSGDHNRIAAWRLEQARERTALRRPDLYGVYQAKQLAIKQLSADKRNSIHMMESLKRGRGEIIYTSLWSGGEDIVLYDREAGVCMLAAENPEKGKNMAGIVPEAARLVLTAQPFLEDILTERGYRLFLRCRQVLYTQKSPLPVRHREIRRLSLEDFEEVRLCCAAGGEGPGGAHDGCGGQCEEPGGTFDRLGGPGVDEAYLRKRLQAGALYGAFFQGRLAGIAGIHEEGALGLLHVAQECRRCGIGASLEAYVINRMLEKGWTPYGHVEEGNEASMKLQEKLGLYVASKTFLWMEKKLANEADV